MLGGAGGDEVEVAGGGLGVVWVGTGEAVSLGFWALPFGLGAVGGGAGGVERVGFEGFGGGVEGDGDCAGGEFVAGY